MEGIRIWRSPYSDFYRNDTLDAARVYTPDHLREIADAGFNAIWLRGILREILRSRVFPEFGRNSAAHLRSLRAVMRRAERVGIRLFLYMQEPRGMPVEKAFWRRHPEARGAIYRYWGRDIAAMCTSARSVRDFLSEGAEALSRRLPGLGGVILVTASEHISHCYVHYRNKYAPAEMSRMHGPLGCPRCERRRPADVIADVIGSFKRGFDAAGNGTRLIAWNWSWGIYESDPQEGILRALPRGIMVMAGFERGGRKRILGKDRVIDEYSLSYPGPSGRFLGTMRAARRRGMRVMAKLQFGTTHELATVPNLPLIGVLYEKARAMRRLRVRDFMGCWNFGNMLTANTAAFHRFLTIRRLPPRDQALRAFAAGYFPGCDARAVVRAWEQFRRAMDSYPFCIPFLYYGPINYAVAHPIEPGPLRPEPVGRSWMPDRDRGDELKDSFGPYTLREIIHGLGELVRGWWKGVELFEAGVAGCKAATAVAERNTARVIGHCFQSTWNLYRAYSLRRDWIPGRRKALEAIMRDERDHLRRALPIIASDRRMGFHAECQAHLFTAVAVRRKLRRLDALLDGTGVGAARRRPG